LSPTDIIRLQMGNQDRFEILKLVIILTFVAGIIIVVAGIILFLTGGAGETTITMFGHELRTQNVGIAAIFIGAILILVTFIKVLKLLGIRRNGNGPQRLKAAIAIVIKDKQVILVKRKYAEGKLRWQFPAGIIRPTIQKEEVVKSETKKETGVICNISKYLGNRIQPDTNTDAYYYLCDYASGEIDNLQPEENEEVKWVDAKEVKNYITSDLYKPVEEALESLS